MASLLNLKNMAFTSFEEEDRPVFHGVYQVLCSF